MSSPQNLTGLTTREAIIDAVYRLLDAYDTNDSDLLMSALQPDITLVIGDQSMSGPEAVKAQNFGWVGKMDTTHFVTTPRVNVKGDDATTASMTCNVLAQHYPAGKGTGPEDKRLLAGTRYYLDLVKDEKADLWKIERWEIKIVWTEGDWSVMSPS